MSISKLRGKSSTVTNGHPNKNQLPQPQNLLKIEPFVPSLNTRLRKPIHRSYSTLSSSYFKNLPSHRKNILSGGNSAIIGGRAVLLTTSSKPRSTSKSSASSNNSGTVSASNGVLTVTRSPKDQEKLPDRINYDRRGLTAIPIFENEQNLRLLSLQHNLINVFHIPDEEFKEKSVVNSLKAEESITITAKKRPLLVPPKSTGSKRNLLSGSTSMKKSNSFMMNYAKHLNTIRKNLQKNGYHPQIHPTQDTLPYHSSPEPETALKIENRMNTPQYGKTFQNLVFLDLYDNQIDRVGNLDGLKNLTVLLLGKNRITDISGLASLKTSLRVLDLHGNKLTSITNKINCLQELKSLNIAGNQIRQINQNDFAGLMNLKELNLKRNKIKKIYGFHHLTSLERLWLCHNDLQKVEDMSTIAKAINLQEVTIENNPVSLAGDCVSFLVSYLPKLSMLSQMPITDQVRRAAMAWRKNKEISDSNYSHLSSDVFSSIRREEVISNARTNWELLRTKNQPLPPPSAIDVTITTKSTSNSSSSSMSSVSTPSSSSPSTSSSMSSLSTTGEQQNRNDTNEQQNPSHQQQQQQVKLPPILQKQQQQQTEQKDKDLTDEQNQEQQVVDEGRGSSLGPNIDSSSSYLSSSDNEDTNNNNNKDTSSNKEKVGFVVNRHEEGQISTTFECTEDVLSDLPIVKTHKEVSIVELDTSSVTNAALVAPQTKGLPKNQKNPSTPMKRYMQNSLIRSQTQTVRNCGGKSNVAVTPTTTATPSSLANCIPVTIISSTNTTTVTQSIGAATVSGAGSTSSSVAVVATGNISNTNATSSPGPAVASKQTEREREQGGDYLIEICGRYLNIYGLGALRFIDKQWNPQKANDVHTLNFSYINFNNIASILGEYTLLLSLFYMHCWERLLVWKMFQKFYRFVQLGISSYLAFLSTRWLPSMMEGIDGL